MKKREDDEEEEDRQESDGGDRTAAVINVWDCGSPLYDSFELVSVAHLIERNMRALPPSPPSSGRSSAAEMDNRYRGLLARRSGDRKRKSEESTAPKVRKLKSGFYSFFATVGLIKK
ncbi:PREDICTED: uncharacterized protein LOC109164936 isoform X2 [Ipomoea nil]|uniref:uncharacterized protein LOC109164936 isoform X2 n=1 Tax=Ipomoea nil TaxID=35883 RepID=UPI000901574B|nr:PREDICTED: uncharacterized protein LOC109164936 isoform X2 [Ipomoea nil]